MRRCLRASMLVIMSPEEPVRVALELNRTRRTISGQLAVDGAPASGFYGWLELIDELGRAVGASAETPCAEESCEPECER